jgi:hypothetical protein
MRYLTLAALLLGLAAAAPRTTGDDPKKSDDKGWVQLFNGKDLTGWKTHPSDQAKWEVKDGLLVSSGPKGHLFSDRGDYENFCYRVEAKISDHGNSGQYFRTAFGPSFPKGYEAQINSTHGDPVKTGSLYNFVKIFKQLHKPDEWFTQEVCAIGNHIVIKVNGEKTVDFVDDKSTFMKGHFAIQQHDPGGSVTIRKIEVKELPAGATDPALAKEKK